MAEDILIDRVSAKCNWDEVCIDLKQEAEIRRVSVEDLIKEILIEDNFNETIEVESINWSKLMKNEDPEIEEIED